MLPENGWDLHAQGNFLEALLWWLIAAFFGYYAWRSDGRRRGLCLWAMLVFSLFGLSDIVEISTGAWWRPWWLLVWKAGCVVAMLYLLGEERRLRRTEPGPGRE